MEARTWAVNPQGTISAIRMGGVVISAKFAIFLQKFNNRQRIPLMAAQSQCPLIAGIIKSQTRAYPRSMPGM